MRPSTDQGQHAGDIVLKSAEKAELHRETSGNGFSQLRRETSGNGFLPLRLAPLTHPFDDPEFIFELKYDGFRALAYVDDCAGARMISRHGNVYKSFPRLTAAIADGLKGCDAVLDGEIVCFSGDGKPRFFDLLRRRQSQYFCAFDLLRLNGRDVRDQPLVERKRLLKALIPPQPCAVVYVEYV